MIDKNIQFASDLRTVVTRLTKKLRKLSQTGLQFSFTERSTLSLLLHNENGLLPSELAAAGKNNQSIHVADPESVFKRWFNYTYRI